MAPTQRSSPESCAYCGTPIDGERAYRRHLHDAHDASELGAIDRRRSERYRPEPNVVVRAGGEVAGRLDGLRYPVGGTTMARYAAYGFLSSVLVATALGVGL
ncbi:MAG: hypothetical protein ABEJ06_01910 [Haloarculaceae archaeon]